MSISIMLVDDHAIVRRGLRALLSAERNLNVVGDCGEGLEAVKLALGLRPDVIVLDLMMRDLSGLEVARQLAKSLPHTRVVVLSMHADEAYVQKALRHGVLGYVLKESDESDLIEAVREAAAGRHYLSKPISKHAIFAYVRQIEQKLDDPYERLTTREREVLHLTVQGKKNTEIAASLHISPSTVTTHRRNLMRKLGVHNQSELLRYALQRGILAPKLALS